MRHIARLGNFHGGLGMRDLLEQSLYDIACRVTPQAHLNPSIFNGPCASLAQSLIGKPNIDEWKCSVPKLHKLHIDNLGD